MKYVRMGEDLFFSVQSALHHAREHSGKLNTTDSKNHRSGQRFILLRTAKKKQNLFSQLSKLPKLGHINHH